MSKTLNAIFEKVNNKYKFEVNYEPPLLSSINPFDLNLRAKSNKSIIDNPAYMTSLSIPSSKGTGTFFSNSYYGQYSRESKAFESYALHEILHSIIFGDAYLQNFATKSYVNDNNVTISLTKSSIMDSYSHLSYNDLALIFSVYSEADFSDNNQIKKIADDMNYLIENHGMTLSEREDSKSIIEQIDLDAIKSEFSKLGIEFLPDWHIETDFGDVNAVSSLAADLVDGTYFSCSLRKFSQRGIFNTNLIFNDLTNHYNLLMSDIPLVNVDNYMCQNSSVYIKVGPYIVECLANFDKSIRYEINKIVDQNEYDEIDYLCKNSEILRVLDYEQIDSINKAIRKGNFETKMIDNYINTSENQM